MRGRVFGVMTAGAFMGMPLGVLLAGYLLETVGVRSSLLLTGGVYLLATVAQTFMPAFREMDAPIPGVVQSEGTAPLHADSQSI
jgi:MFS family permease